MKPSLLLTIDASINLALGIFLVLFPAACVTALGIPPSDSTFYLTILGAVLLGIGISLLYERFRGDGGLGLPGAIIINFCGGLMLSVWLLSSSLILPLRGRIVLWSLALLLVGISGIEIFSLIYRQAGREV